MVRFCPRRSDPAPPSPGASASDGAGPPLLHRYRSNGDPLLLRCQPTPPGSWSPQGWPPCPKTGEGKKKAGETKSIDQDGGDSGRKGGESGDGRVAWIEQGEEEEMEEEAEAIKYK
ncbi:unnamed protein product [Pleuronectes platessa]|uniref:Uncharacterized protein n=1 Tax=Pleuronectes platessa TaxID=8262 RepID=A0A9N7VYX5_PLEPL|nr:unnamed protein product [Pleuronectes platessa]